MLKNALLFRPPSSVIHTELGNPPLIFLTLSLGLGAGVSLSSIIIIKYWLIS
ncbi:MAG: hypothetical protein ACTSP9_11655 [Promethearchaeota archaeon]